MQQVVIDPGLTRLLNVRDGDPADAVDPAAVIRVAVACFRFLAGGGLERNNERTNKSGWCCTMSAGWVVGEPYFRWCKSKLRLPVAKGVESQIEDRAQHTSNAWQTEGRQSTLSIPIKVLVS